MLTLVCILEIPGLCQGKRIMVETYWGPNVHLQEEEKEKTALPFSEIWENLPQGSTS